MAGYIGSKAVLLSTTAAVVTGDMTVAGATTLSGAFTSLGIDDNATSTAITIDASENVGIGVTDPDSALEVQSSASGLNSVHLSNTSSAGYGAKFVGGGTTATQYIADFRDYAGASKVKIDGSGNVGIGVASPKSQLEVFGEAQTYNFNAGTDPLSNFTVINDNTSAGTGSSIVLGSVYNSGTGKVANARIFAERQSTGSVNAGATDLIFEVGTASGSALSERMRISATGNVGIGTSSPSYPVSVQSNSSAKALLILGRSSDDIGEIAFRENDNSTVLGELQYRQDRAILRHRVGYLSFATGGTSERMRIDASGNVIVGKTAINTAAVGGELRASGLGAFVRDGGEPLFLNRLTSDGAIAVFRKGGTTVGTISVTASATAYNTSSDYRLKENITPIQGAADTVMAMQPCTYTAIADGVWYDGFLAHELQEVHPRAVQGTKDAMMDEEYEVTPAVYEDVVTPAVDAVAATYDDEGLELTPAVEAVPETTESTLVTEAVMGTRSVPDMQSVDYSKLTPILTAALQEALTKIEALEVRLTALEATP